MKIENFKMRVTPEQSKRVQEVCFDNGVAWPGGDKTIQEKAEYLFLEHYGLCGNLGVRMTCSSDFSTFSVAQLPETTYAGFMAKYAPETKPQLNPAHLAIAFRIFGHYTDVDSIAKIVNIVLENVELFEKLRGLENEFNR